MAKKKINISINSYGFAVEAKEIRKSTSNNETLVLWNGYEFAGSIDLNVYKFEFSWSNEYTNYYRLIEK